MADHDERRICDGGFGQPHRAVDDRDSDVGSGQPHSRAHDAFSIVAGHTYTNVTRLPTRIRMRDGCFRGVGSAVRLKITATFQFSFLLL